MFRVICREYGQYLVDKAGSVLAWLDWLLPVGPRSVLWGAHCWFIHPWFVALGWWKLYGFPKDYRLWIMFFVHDLGYLVRWCREMDSEAGEDHVLSGARFMGYWFGEEWYWESLCHSRYYAEREGHKPSRLCWADKYSVCLEPAWLYLPRVVLSGEVWEYLKYAQGRVASRHGDLADSEYARRSQTMGGWRQAMIDFLRDKISKETGVDVRK